MSVVAAVAKAATQCQPTSRHVEALEDGDALTAALARLLQRHWVDSVDDQPDAAEGRWIGGDHRTVGKHIKIS
jgi:2-keto-4-pentenoate hydratase